MRRSHSSRAVFRTAIRCITLVILFALAAPAQSLSPQSAEATPEQKTDRYFESIRKSPPQMLAFLLKMPKGGDLHNHLSGSVYAESYIDWAAKKELCVNQVTMNLLPPSPSPCDQAAGQVPV